MIHGIPAPDVLFGLLMAAVIVSTLSLVWGWLENSRLGMRRRVRRMRRRAARQRRQGW